MKRSTTARLRHGALALTALAVCAPHPVAEAATPRDSVVVGGAKHLRLLDPDTRKIRSLPGSPGARNFGFDRTADGRTLLDFDMTGDGPVVLRYSLATGKTQRSGPFKGPAGIEQGRAFSPDGLHLALATFTSGVVGGSPNGNGTAEQGPVRVDVLNVADGSTTSLVAPIPAKERGMYGDHQTERFQSLAWSPDGTKIAYVHTHKWELTGAPADDKPFAHLVVAGADGSSSRTVAQDLDQEVRGIAWSPDGRDVVAATTKGLQLIDMSDGTRKTITTTKTSSAVFSASGKYLAYNAHPSIYASVLHIRRLATGQEVKPKMSGASTPSWARSGDRLVACSRNGLRLVTAAGKVKKLTSSRDTCPASWQRASSYRP